MRYLRKLALLVVIVLIMSLCSVPAFATDTGMQIQVSGGNGITINPGQYPNLGSADDAPEEAAKTIISKGKLIGQTITAVCALVYLVFFFINITKLSTSGAMSFQRRQAITGLLWSGVSLALFGGAWTVITFFWNFLTQ